MGLCGQTTFIQQAGCTNSLLSGSTNFFMAVQPAKLLRPTDSCMVHNGGEKYHCIEVSSIEVSISVLKRRCIVRLNIWVRVSFVWRRMDERLTKCTK